PRALGSVVVKVRATDDSCNREVPGPGRQLTIGPRPLPATLWEDSVVPIVPAAADTTPVTVGVRFRVAFDGFIAAIRFYAGDGNTGPHVARLWSDGGTLLGRADPPAGDPGPPGWQTARFPAPAAV